MQRHLNDSNLEENKAVLDVIRRRVEVFDDRFVFGEFSEEFERSGCYLPSDRGLHSGYNFALLVATDAAGVRAHLETLAHYPEHWPAISFSNHDVIRTASRFGEGSAKVMLALLFALRGTVLLYQGEELGLPEVDLKREQLRDPVGDLYYPLFKGRDGCRTPMPWDAAKPNLGFSSGAPWLPLGSAHARLAVSVQENDPGSPLVFARRMLKARKDYASLRSGELELLETKGSLVGFVRHLGDENIICVFNLSDKTAEEVNSLFQLAIPLQIGCGESKLNMHRLTLGPLSAWFGRL
jgi:alpha-glucosidase